MAASQPSVASPPPLDAIIVGGGVSGIAAARYLLRADPALRITILEKGPGWGGTWLWNTYPGAACDVPSHWYSFSWALNPTWTRRFSSAPEIRGYLERSAATLGLNAVFQTRSAVESATWDEAAASWVVSVRKDGATTELRARFLVAGPGALSTPCTPSLPGASTFAGASFHSGTWRGDISLEGKRVGVIGTGCSSAQIVPEIAKSVSALTVFQRTPAWLTPVRLFSQGPHSPSSRVLR